jgi:SAM-dependent methyltransferase
MIELANATQSDAWNGYEGDHWAAHYGRYDAVNGGFNEPLLIAGRVSPGHRVLDIGCGTGQLTRLAARRAATATGIDLSGPMLTRAREQAQAEEVGTVSFVQGDVQVYPFRPGAFDVALSRFGIMFFADPVAAFTNIAHALRPGGRLAFVSLTPLADSQIGVVFDAIAPHLPGFEIGPGRGAFADPGAIRKLLGTTGFHDVTIQYTVTDSVWGRDLADATEFIMNWGPVRHQRSKHRFLTDDRVEAAIIDAVRPLSRRDGVHLDAAAWPVSATAPS